MNNNNQHPVNRLTRMFNRLDRFLRRFDWRLQRNYGKTTRYPLQVHGHSIISSTLPFLLLFFIVLGPSLGFRGWPAALFIVLLLSVLYFLYRKLVTERSFILFVTLFILMAAALSWYGLADDSNLERSPDVYRHIVIPGYLLLFFAIIFSRMLAWCLFRNYCNRFVSDIRKVELFQNPDCIEISWLRLGRSLLTAPLYHPVQLFFLPALAVLVIADRTYMEWSVWGLLALSWLLLAAGDIHPRLSAMLEIVNGWFFVGAQLLVSLVVIGLGFGRYFQESYITTLMEGSGGVNITILLYVIAAYLFLWFYEYWINRNLSEQVINFFRLSGDDRYTGKVKYDIDESAVKTRVQKNGRVLQTHGSGRFVVVGQTTGENPCEAWHTYSRMALLETFQDQLSCAAQHSADLEDTLETSSVIAQRIRFYFAVMNVLLPVVVGGAAGYFFNLPQKAELTANLPSPERKNELLNLQHRLFAAGSPEKPILLAASGGGTRAALYTESVLRGLANNKLLDNVVLVSGVSGGSAALAYFAMHRAELVQSGKDQDAKWRKFSEIMANPFIQDVLNGVVEWRIMAGVRSDSLGTQGGVRHGVRIGELLAESFLDRFAGEIAAVHRFGEQKHLGIILNTTLVGEFPRWKCGGKGPDTGKYACVCQTDQPLAVREHACKQLQTSVGQGGRVIFTNLAKPESFPQHGLKEAPREYLTYAVINDPRVELARAAALSANFPPVFSNAAVDVDGQQRYWVTDGGAADNRGILSLLYALRGAIAEERKMGNRDQRQRPEIHIVVAEASATSLRFGQDRGLGGKFGAAERFASQLMQDLIIEIRNAYQAIGGTIKLHYLAMPLVLRSNGGLGTHWMLPKSVKFRKPMPDTQSGKMLSEGFKSIRMSGRETRAIIDSLHSGRTEQADTKESEKVLWQWICNDSYTRHREIWNDLLIGLTGSQGKDAACPVSATN